MVYAAPPLRALLRRVSLAARGGLEGGDGFPLEQSVRSFLDCLPAVSCGLDSWGLTEPTSGPPLDPGGPRSAVMEAIDRRVAKAHSVAGSAGLSARTGVRANATITTTTTVTFHGGYRHCYSGATVALLAEESLRAVKVGIDSKSEVLTGPKTGDVRRRWWNVGVEDWR